MVEERQADATSTSNEVEEELELGLEDVMELMVAEVERLKVSLEYVRLSELADKEACLGCRCARRDRSHVCVSLASDN